MAYFPKKWLSAWSPILLYAFGIAFVSSLRVHAPTGWDKLLHFLEYGVLGFLLVRALLLSSSLKIGRIFWIVLSLGAIFAGLDEFFQSYFPYRESSWADALADVFGIGCGAGLYSLLLSYFYQTKRLYPEVKTPGGCGAPCGGCD